MHELTLKSAYYMKPSGFEFPTRVSVDQCTIRYDTIRYKNLTRTQKLSVVSQLNLAQVGRNKIVQKEIKTNKRQCPFCPGSRFVKAVQIEPERMCRKRSAKEISLKSGVKG